MRNFPLFTIFLITIIFMSLVPVAAQEGIDELEPNDTMERATSISGGSIDGQLGIRGDRDDWFLLEGQGGRDVTVTLYYDDRACDIDMDVYSGDTLVGSLTSVSSPDSGTFHIPRTCYLHVYAYSDEGGSYTVEISSEHDSRPPASGHRGCEGPDEREPNDRKNQADTISEYFIEGYACEGEEDWYVLEGQESFNPTFILTYVDEICDIDMEIYSDNEWVGELNSSSSPDTDEFDVPATCFLHVFAWSGEGEYTIEIIPEEATVSPENCEGPDEWEPNDSEDLADSIDGYTIEGYACEGEQDWFILEGQEGFYPLITVTYDDDVCDIDVEVRSGAIAVGWLNSTSSPDSDEFHVEGQCILIVTAFSGEGAYTIDIDPRMDTDEGTDHEECEGPDEWESNDEIDLADPIGGTRIEGYCCEDEDDWFILEGKAGDCVTLTFYYDETSCDLDLEVYSADEYVGSLSSVGSPDTGEFHVAGTYYIHVWAYEGYGDYVIEIAR